MKTRGKRRAKERREKNERGGGAWGYDRQMNATQGFPCVRGASATGNVPSLI